MPGGTGFATSLAERVDGFYKQRKLTLANWCKEKDIKLNESLSNGSPSTMSQLDVGNEDILLHKRNQRQLYLVLYVSS